MKSRLLTCSFFATAALILAAPASQASSATWNQNPPSNLWFNTADWTPATIPDSATDVATFGITNLSAISGFGTALSEVVFNPGASSYSFTIPIDFHTISGAGITNGAGTQKFTIEAGNGEGTFGDLSFTNSANAGTNTQFTINGSNDPNSFSGEVVFYDNASAGFATYALLPGTRQGGSLLFNGQATAGTGVFTDAGFLAFNDASSAGDGYFEITGGPATMGAGGYLTLASGSRGGSGQFIIDAGSVSGAQGGVMVISGGASAESALIFANDGPGDGGLIQFLALDTSTAGGMATFQLNGKGKMDISGAGTNVAIGSLSGSGPVFLGGRKLTAGRNLMGTFYSGLLQDGGISGGTGGSFAKVGSGTLTLMGSNTYTGSTSLNGGTLRLINTTGSVTGTGPVQANAGNLGGSAIIAGTVTIGANNTDRPHLTPATGSQVPGSLTIQSTLIFNSNGGYNHLLRASGRRILSDRVNANGVIINPGASFTLLATVKGTVQVGTGTTVINNTSANPISGIFVNLPDGAVLTIGDNKFQANYEGGDGNDLTLTVIP